MSMRGAWRSYTKTQALNNQGAIKVSEAFTKIRRNFMACPIGEQ